MTKKLFSGGIYREGLRRIKVFAIIACALIFCFQALPAVTNAIFNSCPTERSVIDSSSICLLLPAIAIIMPVILVMMLFSQFNKRPYSDFAHSLPYTRTCIFLTKTAVVYTALFFFMALSIGTGTLAYSLFPSYYALNFTGMLPYVLKYITVAAFVTSSFQIAVSLTGTLLSNMTAALLILFFPRFILSVITTAITSANPFMDSGMYIPLLASRYNTFIGLFTSVAVYDNRAVSEAGPIIYTFVISAVYLCIALLIFNKRKSETAEQPAPGRKVQAAIRILIALVFTVPATAFLVSERLYELELAILLYALGIVAYFAYELITTRSWKNLLRAIPALLIVAAINVLVALTVFGVSFVSENYTPTANEIDSVRIRNSGNSPMDSTHYLPDGSDTELRDMKTKAIVAEVLSENVAAWKDRTYENYYSEKYTRYTVLIDENGFVRSRALYLTDKQESELLGSISRNEDFIAAYMDLPDAIEGTLDAGLKIDPSYEDEILDTFRKEVDALGFEKWYVICTEGYDNYNAEMLNLRYYPEGYTNAVVYVTLSSEVFPETFSTVLKANHAVTDKDNILRAAEILDDSEMKDYIDFESISITVVYGGKRYSYNFSYFMDGDFSVGADILPLIRDAAKSEKAPEADRYMYLQYSIDYRDKNEKSRVNKILDGTYYLPLPDRFDPANYPCLNEEAVEYADGEAAA